MSNKEQIRLRPHHGLCLGFFEGRGYSDAFSRNMAEVLAQLEQNGQDEKELLEQVSAAVEIRLTEEKEPLDIICQSCPKRESGCPKAAEYDRRVLTLCGFKPGQKVTWHEMKETICTNILQQGKLGEVCRDCQWFAICSYKNAAAEK